MKWIIRVRECEIVPLGYGGAWQDWTTRTVVCMPMPFNVIAALLRRFYIWMLSGFWPSSIDKRIQAAVNAERAYTGQRERYHAEKEDAERRRRDFRAGYEYAHVAILSELGDKPLPKIPEWAK